jgi:hypothetical protein
MLSGPKVLAMNACNTSVIIRCGYSASRYLRWTDISCLPEKVHTHYNYESKLACKKVETVMVR